LNKSNYKFTLDFSDKDITKTLDELLDSNSETDWVVLGHEGTSTKIKVEEKGSGFEELEQELNPGKILYILSRFKINNISKYALISWCGGSVQEFIKGKYNVYSKDMEAFLKGRYHIHITARNDDDVNEEEIKKKLKIATGANFDATTKKEDLNKKVSINETKQNIKESTTKIEIKKQDIAIDKNKSEEFWKNNQEEKKNL